MPSRWPITRPVPIRSEGFSGIPAQSRHLRRGFATIGTLSMLSGFLFAIHLGFMIAYDAISLPIAALLAVQLNLAMLLVSPTINDVLYAWLSDFQWISLAHLGTAALARPR